MVWKSKTERPKTPQRGKLKSGAVTAAKGKRGAKARGSRGTPVKFCEPGPGAKSRGCRAYPKTKAKPAAPPKSNVTSANFHKRQSGKDEGTIKGVCGNVRPGVCAAQIGYRDGRRVLRFCTVKGKPGHVVDIHGKDPAAVRSLSQKACAAWTKKGSYASTPVAKAALGGVRKRKLVKGRKRSSR